MSLKGAATVISEHHLDHLYEETSIVAMPDRTTNIQSTVTRYVVPLILTGINTALICVIIATAVYFTWKSNAETTSIRKMLDELNSKLDFEWKNDHEWKSSYHTKMAENLNDKLETLKNACKSGWSYYAGHWYYFSQDNKTFNDAKSFCASLNGSVVKIEDVDEDKWIANYLTRNTWIGAMRDNNGKYTWLDGTPLIYKGFHLSQPDGTGPCVQYWNHNGYGWDDIGCFECRQFVCEKTACW